MLAFVYPRQRLTLSSNGRLRSAVASRTGEIGTLPRNYAIDSGEYKDRAELARQLGLTRARATQLLNLTLLAPDIQEQVLDLEAVDGVEPTSERALREIVGLVDWGEQRERWGHLDPNAD